MATCYPDYGGDYSEIPSQAEIKFYESCLALPDEFQIFHSVGWISRSDGEARDGEADFLICHPSRGYVVIEVKGGRIAADYAKAQWTSTDRRGRVHVIKDPFRQASTAKFNILSKLKEHKDWGRLRIGRIGVGHAVFFPDVDDGEKLRGPNAPIEIIGDGGHLHGLQAWLNGVFDFWADRQEGARSDPLGPGGIQLMVRLFARVVEARPLLSAQLENEERHRIRLTNRQIQILDLLSRQRRVAISGGAGTGKTVLALEKARRLADEGFKTLLTCYNVPLSKHLAEICRDQDNLDVAGFHKLCKDVVDSASKESARDLLGEAKASYPGLELWDHYFPIALAYALEIVGLRYDAIVVDEGQDFGEEFWLPIEMLLKDGGKSPLYIFHDENQNVYSRASTFPADASPITLTTNCRNTRQVHEVAYGFYSGSPVEASELMGRDVEILDADGLDRQSRAVRDFVSNLLVDEKLPASSIVVLIANRLVRKSYEDALHQQTLPAGVSWKGVDGRGRNSVVVESVARFKGLESEIVILWGIENLSVEERKETLYVGASRAKSILAICGNRQACEAVISGE